MIHLLHRGHIDRYFAGHTSPAAEAALRRRLARCAGCRRDYQLHLLAEAAMPGGEEHALDRLWRGIAQAGASPAAPPRPAPRWAKLALVTALSGAAAIVIVARVSVRDGALSPAEPVARGRLDAAPAAPALHVFRTRSDHAAEPVGDGPIRARDGLLFAYANTDPAFSHLMVFAVDEAYAVHWYYPAYQRQGDNPEAMPIVTSAEGVELGEEIRQGLHPGQVRLYALFLREPRRVLDIESMIHQLLETPRRALAEATQLPIPGSAQPSFVLKVEP